MPTLQEYVSEYGEQQGQNLYVIQQGQQRLANENLSDKERKKVQAGCCVTGVAPERCSTYD